MFKHFSSSSRTYFLSTNFTKAFVLVNDHQAPRHWLPFVLIEMEKLFIFIVDRWALFNSITSDEFPVTSVVLQSSWLGSYLFVIHINDFPSAIKSNHILMHVNDIKLFSSFFLESQLCQLRTDLNNLFKNAYWILWN